MSKHTGRRSRKQCPALPHTRTPPPRTSSSGGHLAATTGLLKLQPKVSFFSERGHSTLSIPLLNLYTSYIHITSIPVKTRTRDERCGRVRNNRGTRHGGEWRQGRAGKFVENLHHVWLVRLLLPFTSTTCCCHYAPKIAYNIMPMNLQNLVSSSVHMYVCLAY